MNTGKEAKIVHIMADGTVYHSIEEVREHIKGKPLPELTERLVLDCIERGRKILAGAGGEKA